MRQCKTAGGRIGSHIENKPNTRKHFAKHFIAIVSDDFSEILLFLFIFKREKKVKMNFNVSSRMERELKRKSLAFEMKLRELHEKQINCCRE